jgi:type I restriction-modification system DNA methylase subunit
VPKAKKNDSAANLGFEATLWAAADALRSSMGSAELHNDRQPDPQADFILANQPFHISDWGGERLRDDKRWQYGEPPGGRPLGLPQAECMSVA